VVKIHTDEIKLLVPFSHKLASKPYVTPQDLIGELLLLPKTGTTRARLNEWLDPIEGEMTISMELDSTEMIKRFVMADLGLSFLAVSHCAEELAAMRLEAISLAPEPMIRRVGLIYRRDKSLSKAALGFIQVTLENSGMGEALIAAGPRLPGEAVLFLGRTHGSTHGKADGKKLNHIHRDRRGHAGLPVCPGGAPGVTPEAGKKHQWNQFGNHSDR
jgi:hypothetical protein